MKDTGLEELLASSTSEPEVLTFYNGEVTLFYDAKLHAYYVEEDGEKLLVPGSTTVGSMVDKSGPLTQWSANSTVNAIIAGLPGVTEFQLELAGLYQKLRDKDPIGEGPFLRMTIHSHTLAELLNKARFNFRELSKDATDIGQVAHDWLEGYINAKIAGLPYPRKMPHEDQETVELLGTPFAIKATNCVKAALDWFDRHKVRFLFAERKLYSRRYRYAGTTDWFGYVTSCGDLACCKHEGEELVCGDFKSSRSLYEEYYIQLASYMNAWNEEFPEQPVTGRLLIRLDKDGDGVETAYRAIDTFDADFDAFLGALAIYGWKKQLELDRKYEKAVIKAEKAAAKAAADAAKPKKTRKPRKIVIKEVTIESAPIPVVGNDGVELLPWEGLDRHPKPVAPTSTLDFEIPVEKPV